jgi:hypothetical protein
MASTEIGSLFVVFVVLPLLDEVPVLELDELPQADSTATTANKAAVTAATFVFAFKDVPPSSVDNDWIAATNRASVRFGRCLGVVWAREPFAGSSESVKRHERLLV